MKLFKPDNLAGEFWGGLAAMLVALPSAIAFGVTIFAPLGASYAAQGAIAGILGTTALGLVAPLLGGTNRLVTAPCAPAAAVLAALAVELSGGGMAPDRALLLMILVALACGTLQVGFGLVGLGRLIKYMPYPVVSGYLSGVGLVIVVSQVPRFLGAPKAAGFVEALGAPGLWSGQAITVGAVTMAVMLTADRFTKLVPAAILGLLAGIGAYFALGVADRTLLEVSGNPLIVGPLGGTGGGFGEAIAGRWRGLAAVEPADLKFVVMPALTLAVLLSIDTLKTCVVLDALTRSRHDSNRELLGQGLANLASTAIGGVPGAGQMGATLVNMSSGGQTRVSSLFEGVLALVAFLVLGSLVAWVPIAALAGILIVVGFRMFDLHSLDLLRSRSTVFDFVVIVTVIVVAKSVSLIAASGVGIALAILLFIREQIGGAVVARKARGDQMFSKQVRAAEEMAVLSREGGQTAVLELQGSLFFGTTDQLYTALEPELKLKNFIILDMRRVQSVDVTAAHMLGQVEDMLAERGGLLIFSALPRRLPSGRDMQAYFSDVGLVKSERRARVFGELDEALEWVEDRILDAAGLQRVSARPLELSEIDLFEGRKAETIAELEARMEKRHYAAGEKIFAYGDAGDEIFLIRRGAVRIVLPLSGPQGRHLATFRRGSLVGEMAFIDRERRSADAYAFADTDLFVLSRERFDAFAAGHKKAANDLLEALARGLARRLRYANAELRALQGT